MALRIVLICSGFLLLTGCQPKVNTQAQFASRYLKAPISTEGVFTPEEAEIHVLPYMEENPSLFKNKRVLEIGTGSGIISLYAAQLGAAKVVATDIDPKAVEVATRNFKSLGFSDVVETRLVPASHPSAYSTLAAAEVFDLIISNPPYSLDLDAHANSALSDDGDLGFSVIDGLRAHLTNSGMAVLLYRSLFYQQLIVKYAEKQGYAVKFNMADIITPWELEALFNQYLEKLNSRRPDLKMAGVRFNAKDESWGHYHVMVQNEEKTRKSPGLIFIRKSN